MNPVGDAVSLSFSSINYSSTTTVSNLLSGDKTSTEINESNSTPAEFGDTSVVTPTRHLTTAEQMENLSVIYASSEALVAFLAIVGNLLVVYVFCTNRSLRRYRNYYIVGLAVADFLVGLLGIPLAVLASVGLPRHLYGCLFTVSVLMVLCTVSILCLVAVSIDRYWATTNPFAYYRNMTTSTSVGIILSCWLVGAIIGFLPLFGWYNHDGWEGNYCIFVKVIDYNYLVFLYFATIIFPSLLMACFYGYIYHIVLIKIRQKGTLVPQGGIRRASEASRSGSLNTDLRGSTQMMRIIVSEKRREAKAAKKLSIIVLFFMICWMPLYTINCVQAFSGYCPVSQQVLDFTIILSHANSALNPFLYAYHLKEFRIAMKNVLCGCFSRLFCGCLIIPVQKEGSSAVSRSQTLTMPSIGNHSSTAAAMNLSSTTTAHGQLQTLSAGKYSIKFRKVVDSKNETNFTNRRHLSPEKAKRLMAASTPSSDNLLANLKPDNAHNHCTHANHQPEEEEKTSQSSFRSIQKSKSSPENLRKSVAVVDDATNEEYFSVSSSPDPTTNPNSSEQQENCAAAEDPSSSDSSGSQGEKRKPTPSILISNHDGGGAHDHSGDSAGKLQTKSLSFNDKVDIVF